MPYVKQIIDGYNKAILKIAGTAQRQKDGGKTCSCRKKEDYPLNGESARRIIYIERETSRQTTQKAVFLPKYISVKNQYFYNRSICKKTAFLHKNDAFLQGPFFMQQIDTSRLMELD